MRIKVRENQMEEIEDIRPEYPYTCHHVEMRDTKVPWHWHEEVEFDRVVQGTLRLKTVGKTVEFARGEGFFTNANVLCAMEGDNEAVMESHLFHPVFLGGHYHSIFETKYLNPVLQNRKLEIIEFRSETRPQRDILAFLQKAERLQAEKDQEMKIRNIFSDIWTLLLEEAAGLETEEPSTSSVDQERLFSMIAYMQEHYAEKVTLEQVAASAMISVRECIRCCKKGIGQTPYEYLMDYRLEMAKKLLRQTGKSVLDIANETGFSGSAYFGKLFRKNLGMTPVEYRKKQGNAIV